MDRWRLGAIAAASSLSLLLFGACGNDDDGGGGGGEITVQYPEFGSFDPHFSSFSQDIGHQNMVWRGLYRYNEESRIEPEMAASLPEVLDDGLRYRVTLKDDLEWSDGDALTAADFVLGIQRSCNPDVAGEYAQLLFTIAGCEEYYAAADANAEDKEELRDSVGVEAIDDTTIEYTLRAEQATFPAILTLWMTWPVPEHLLPDPGAAWPAPTELVFNGPFVVESYTPGERMVFARNEAYGGEHEAYLDRVTFRYIEDNVQSNNAFRNDELNVVVADVANLAALKNEFGDELISYALPSTRVVLMNMNNEALAKEDVRIALSRSINRQELVDTVIQGAGIATTTWVPEDVLAAEADFSGTVGYDAEEAKAALARAGYPGGAGFPELEYLIVDVPILRSVAEYLQAQWKETLGISITIVPLDPQVRGQRYGEGEFDLYPAGFAQDYSDPENWISVVVKDGPLNRQDCQDPEINALYDKAQANADDDERLAQYREINELLSTRLCGMLMLYHEARHSLSKGVTGPREYASPQDLVLAGDRSIEEWRKAD